MKQKKGFPFYDKKFKSGKSKARKHYVKWPSRENYLAFKKAKNKCTSINKKAKKTISRKVQSML